MTQTSSDEHVRFVLTESTLMQRIKTILVTGESRFSAKIRGDIERLPVTQLRRDAKNMKLLETGRPCKDDHFG